MLIHLDFRNRFSSTYGYLTTLIIYTLIVTSQGNLIYKSKVDCNIKNMFIHKIHWGKINFVSQSVTTISYSFEARGLKFGMKIHIINAVKLVIKICEFLSVELR